MIARRFCLEDKGGDAPAAGLRLCLGIDHQQVSDGTVGNEHLCAIEQIAATGSARSHLYTHRIRASIRLGEA